MMLFCDKFCNFGPKYQQKEGMKQLQWAALAVIMIMIGMNISCSRHMFDEDKYNELVDSVSPVDTVDPNHKWTLTVEKVLKIQTPDSGDVQKVKILTANPRETGAAEIVGEAWVPAGEQFQMRVSYSNLLTTLYAALVDDEGRYSIEQIDPETQSEVTFSDLIVDHEKISYDPRPQQFTYCFEAEYPLPGDYDYNDVVLRVSHKRTGMREVQFNVQLCAVGTTEQVAAAIRLAGFNYSEIESVKTIDSLSFNRTNGKDLPDQVKTVVSKDKTAFYDSFLSSGLNGEAVLNLFGDAHWATGDLLEENFGTFDRKMYNVSKKIDKDHTQFVARSITYVVNFKSSTTLNNLSMNQVDPFIMEMYNGGIFEVHQFAFQLAPVLYDYSPSNIKNLPWGLCVPMRDFRWPLEGQNMGFHMKDVHTYGAYQTTSHSFGEWAEDQKKSIDWYKYPKESLVF